MISHYQALKSTHHAFIMNSRFSKIPEYVRKIPKLVALCIYFILYAKEIQKREENCVQLELRQYKNDSIHSKKYSSFEITALFSLVMKKAAISTEWSCSYIVFALAAPLENDAAENELYHSPGKSD